MAISDISAWSLGATSGVVTSDQSGVGGGTMLAGETISGPVAVAFNQSGQVVVAMCSISGRWPAIGVSTKNVLSGQVPAWAQTGIVQFTSGMADYSGFLNRRVYLGRSGQIVTISGSWASGGWLSGDAGQTLGLSANSAGIVVQVGMSLWSGGPAGLYPGIA